MNYELFIAKRIFFSKKGKERISQHMVHIATGGIAISLAVMLIAIGVVIGFKQEVRNKLIGFGSHIQVSASFSNQTYETQPIQFDSTTISLLRNTSGVKHVQRFATQPGILKVNEDFQGVVLKGVDKDFNWDFFQKNLVEGSTFGLSDSTSSNQSLISKKMADLMQLSLGDKYHIYFVINGKVRVRPLEVTGIYSSGFSDYDKLFIIGDIRHVRKLNQWEDDQCSGVEIEINDFQKLAETSDAIYSSIGNKRDQSGNFYMIKTIQEINPQIFSWLDLLDMNAKVILILMMFVAGFTMISGLLILILDRTNMIGVLKALGASNISVQKLFFYVSLLIVGKGMIIGNLLGLTLCFLQKNLHIIKLDPDVYYVNAVPVEIPFIYIILVNIGVFFISSLILRASTFIITKISPIKSIRFE